MFKRDHLKKPPWIKFKIPSGANYREVHDRLKEHGLATVCQEARCPNISECWERKSATIMILGRICTRACRFCAVQTGEPRGRIESGEPVQVAAVIRDLGLRYVVITSVDRDDLADQGSGHYAATVAEIKKIDPGIRVEVLIPDFSGRSELLRMVVESGPDVIGHNLETVRRLTPQIRDQRCGYDRSRNVLAAIKYLNPKMKTKSGFMVGLGESDEEITQTLTDLKERHVDIITVGQYLQPTLKHLPVQKYYRQEEFDEIRAAAERLGIRHVVSGPLVRSSYRAAEIG